VLSEVALSFADVVVSDEIHNLFKKRRVREYGPIIMSDTFQNPFFLGFTGQCEI
jgi:hypothetical protein